MCGRFVASRPVDDIVEQFDVEDVRLPLELLPGPRFNISPQDDVLAIRDAVPKAADDSGAPVRRRLSVYRWGVVPSWAKEPSVGARSFNARAETVADKPMFRTALAKRRCIIPADAFYEWEKLPSTGKRRTQPWCFRDAAGGMIAFAGLFELWHDDSGTAGEALEASGSLAFSEGWLRTCTLITTVANEMMAPIHDRMPVCLTPDQYETWLSPRALEADELAEILAPPPDDRLTAYRVGSAVGNTRAEGPELAEPLAEEDSSAP